MTTKADLEKNGITQAVLLSSMLGVLTLALVNLGTEVSDAFKENVQKIGKLWMPGAEGIGPYSGKETIALVVWLGSWLVLHRWLRDREWNHAWVISAFLMGVAAATTILWPPVIHLMKPE